MDERQASLRSELAEEALRVAARIQRGFVARCSSVVGRWSSVVGRRSSVVGRRSLLVGRLSLLVGRRSSFVGRGCSPTLASLRTTQNPDNNDGHRHESALPLGG